MKTRIIVLVAVGLLLAVVVSIPYFVHNGVQSRVGPQHIFALSKPQQFLTEELALAKARDALGRDGYDVAVWQPSRDGRTIAPDGRTDEFMARNAVTPNRGVIMFTSTKASRRLVSVELDGIRVVCRTSIPK